MAIRMLDSPTARGRWEPLHGGQGWISLEYQTYTSTHPFDPIVNGLTRVANAMIGLGSDKNPCLKERLVKKITFSELGLAQCNGLVKTLKLDYLLA